MAWTLPETAVVHHSGEKAPITLTACGLRTGRCGDGLVAVARSCVRLSKPARIMFSLCTLADIKVFHLFPRHLFVCKGGVAELKPQVYKVRVVLK